MFKFCIFLFLCMGPTIILKAENRNETSPFCVLNTPVDAGFGAIFISVLSAIDRYDRGECSGLHVDLNSGMYLDGAKGFNWWEYFFKPIALGDPNAPQYIYTESDVLDLVRHGCQMTRERSNSLINQYVKLLPEMTAEINSFVKKNFKGHFVIAVHHRGTDKILEAPIVPYQTTLFHVDWWMANLPKKLKPIIFVATDDQDFLNTLIKIYGKKVKYCNFVRSSNGEPLHYSTTFYSNNYQKAKEAIVDCILLSKGDLLLFPASSAFSMTALKFNPGMSAIPLTGY